MVGPDENLASHSVDGGATVRGGSDLMAPQLVGRAFSALLALLVKAAVNVHYLSHAPTTELFRCDLDLQRLRDVVVDLGVVRAG